MAVSRVDSAGHPYDSHFHYQTPGGTPGAFKSVGKGGVTTDADVLTAPPTGAITFGSAQVSAAFTANGADRYIAEAWLNSTPDDKKVKVGTASPLVVTGLAAGASSVRVRGLGDAGPHSNVIMSDWGTTATGTVS
jgi:hypothetical protein